MVAMGSKRPGGLALGPGAARGSALDALDPHRQRGGAQIAGGVTAAHGDDDHTAPRKRAPDALRGAQLEDRALARLQVPEESAQRESARLRGRADGAWLVAAERQPDEPPVQDVLDVRC